MSEVRIQVLIDRDTRKGKFKDALYFDNETYSQMTPEQIEAAIQARVDNYLAFRDAQDSIEPAEPTTEELQAEKDRLLAQLQEIEDKLGGE